MCDARDVSASGSYAWAARADRPTRLWRDELVGVIGAVHAEVKPRYGRPRMHAELNARGHACSRNTAAELMKAHGPRAKAPRRFVRTTDSNHGRPVAGNALGRDFTAVRPNEKWAMGITYVPTRVMSAHQRSFGPSGSKPRSGTFPATGNR
ncbi:IS3 family transposase [Limnoglobus roseus]|uniref:IS3 family transposase n=1 Tax=Limnoglobus roseus TaxID=2598579 RepID=A0A5C1AMK6_9BACT|nr:IS3 family transposase [Limnoglobus roseus]QEL19367.1 IS3 family transposase [Limnoglobus roseus]